MIFAVTYGLGCASFLAMMVLTLINQRRPQGMALVVLGLYALTAAWALLAALPLEATQGAAHAVETIKTWAWLQFVASMLIVNRRHAGRDGDLRIFRYALPALGLVAFLNDAQYMASTDGSTDFTVSQMAQRVVLGVIGVLMVENLVRNTLASRRWHIAPFVLATGMLFAYDLFVFAEALFMRRVDSALLAGRGLVLVIIAPMLMLTMVRNENWRIDLHVSRKVVFHSTTLTMGGLFLLAAGVIASFVGQVPGTWGPMLRVTFFCASIMVLLVSLSTESIRARIRRFLFENFFSTRYDYRLEWNQFVETLSAAHDVDSLATRAIRAIAKVVDSPGGALWLAGPDGSFRAAATLNLSLDRSLAESADGALVAAFAGGDAILQCASAPSLPGWVRDARIWIALPLARQGRVMGFVALLHPRAGMVLNWETHDLLRLLARQVASYLSEETATRALAEGAVMLEYNKRFAFVVHDVKNLASQLGMTVANARNFIANPEFQADMIGTIENSVSRMNILLERLRSGADWNGGSEQSDPVSVARSVLADMGHQDVHIALDAAPDVGHARMGLEALRSVFTHLLTNAVEASVNGDDVNFRIRETQNAIVAEIADRGCGMDDEFVRNELFSPLRSTKRRGHGIGAFQAQELVRACGGMLEVFSAPGKGTTMKISLPHARPDTVKSA